MAREGSWWCKVGSGGRSETHCGSSGGHRCSMLLGVMLNLVRILLLVLVQFSLILILVLLNWFLVLFKVLLGLLLVLLDRLLILLWLFWVLLVLVREGFLLVHRLLLVLMLLHPVGCRVVAVDCFCLLVGGLHTLNSSLDPSP